MRLRTVRRAGSVWFAIPLAALVAVGVTGCTAPDSAPSAHHSAAPTGRTPSAQEGAITQITHRPGTEKGYVGAVKDVRITTCSADKAPARFGGTVTNPTSSTQDYRIYVSVQNGSTTLGVREVDMNGVGGHATRAWSGSLPVGKAGATCILRVERHS